MKAQLATVEKQVHSAEEQTTAGEEELEFQ